MRAIELLAQPVNRVVGTDGETRETRTLSMLKKMSDAEIDQRIRELLDKARPQTAEQLFRDITDYYSHEVIQELKEKFKTISGSL